jgi:hypothetical protein
MALSWRSTCAVTHVCNSLRLTFQEGILFYCILMIDCMKYYSIYVYMHRSNISYDVQQLHSKCCAGSSPLIHKCIHTHLLTYVYTVTRYTY